MLADLVGAYRQNEKCKSSEASLYVLNNGMECVESFLETLDAIEDNYENPNFNEENTFYRDLLGY
jgi:hypothetical protein